MQHRALGAARVIAIAAASVVLVTCTEPTTAPRITQGPLFAISDGASGGNPDVFFLPPLASTPHGGSYNDRPSNPNLLPVAQICRLNATEASPNPSTLECEAPAGGDDSLPMAYGGGYYSVNWKTSDTPLDTNSMYRIGIYVGTVELAFRDVDPDPGPPRGACKTTDDFCQFQNGSNVAIKVEIHTDAVCFALDPSFNPSTDPCATASLNAGGSLSLSDLSIASVDQGTTINMQPCGDFRQRGLVDLRTFGECVSIADLNYVPGVSLGVTGTATLCHAFSAAISAGLDSAQAERMTVHRFSSEKYPDSLFAEPHAEAGDCSTLTPSLGLAPTPNGMDKLYDLASRTWHAASDRVRSWIETSPLWAAPPPPCHSGGCGSITVFESDFQVAQPAWMAYDPGNPGSVTDGVWSLGTYDAGDLATGTIDVFDSGELEGSTTTAPAPVDSVGLHVQVNGGTPYTILSGPFGGSDHGIAQFQFTVAAGDNTVKVWGMGVGKQGDPNTVLNVFAPSMNTGTDSVALRADTLVFTANGRVPLYFNPDPPSGNVLYTNADGVASFDPPFMVCTDPTAAGVAINTLEAVTNNGTYKSLGGLPAFPVYTVSDPGHDDDGCFTFAGVTIDGTGAFHLVANGQYSSAKFNVKPGH